ncbi:MAG TPA: CHAT domain-containing protein [Kofleriaceae bacterium]|jgi:hypothetical protein|nr:CHAT domain-containing protein [Kofleriaceae bacterium]
MSKAYQDFSILFDLAPKDQALPNPVWFATWSTHPPVLDPGMASPFMVGTGRAEALRRAKLQLLRQPRFAHPYYWAAFIPARAWTPLDPHLLKRDEHSRCVRPRPRICGAIHVLARKRWKA